LRLKAIALLLALATALVAFAATPAKKPKPSGAKTTAKKASSANASKSKGTSSVKSTAGKKAASTGKKTSSAKQAPARYRRTSQREPAPERYQEIQQSLADKGYYSGLVNGAWGSDSVAALKRFQRDQNIGDDGKLGSLSLIALGLGPKRGSPETPAPEQ
jgi:peptidoglycan hydrolase-like protein with peptidoglycan-binding domain